MEILYEGALDKALMVPVKITYSEQTWKTIYEVVEDNYFEQYDVNFLKQFLIIFKVQYNDSHLIPVEVKKSIQQAGIEHGLFSHIVKIKRTFVS